MKFDELSKIIKIQEIDGKYYCPKCLNSKGLTKRGIATHYFYSHTKDGLNSKNKIKTKLLGQSKKDFAKNKEEKINEDLKLIFNKKNLDRNEIKQFLDTIYKDRDLSNVGRWIKLKYINIYNSIFLQTHYLKQGCSFTERLYHILNDIYSYPTCKQCNNITSFKTFYSGYYLYCGIKCSSNDKEIIKKKQTTCFKKYGVSHQSKDESIKEKKIQTSLKNFGTIHPTKSIYIKEKIKKTFIENYGVTNPMKIESIQKTVIDSFTKHCKEDIDFISKLNEKRKNTNIKNFGADHFMKIDSEPKRKIIKLQKEKFNKYILNYMKKNNLKLNNEYSHAHNKQLWECTICNTKFYQIWNSIQQGFLCPRCHPRPHGLPSKPELDLLNFIKEILPNEEVISGSRKIISPKELDIYIPSKRLAIEFNGLYWHSDEMIKDDAKLYHLNKTNSCKSQGIQLIHIFEDEWYLKNDIVKSRLKNLLKINSTFRVYARKCKIKEIDPRTKNIFLEQNHIQGKDSSVIKLGAFYQNELVSVMTFSKGNISKGSKFKEGVWELNRFCSKLDYQVIGIAGKLLKHFKKNYEWKEIFSYADRRWSNGNVYEKLGFELSHNTIPSYWYIKGYQRIHRFNLRKRSDEPKDIPEWVLRANEGYSKIWDCGSLKYRINYAQ